MPSDPRQTPASFSEALKFWIKHGFINFGGPAGQISIMHQEVVEKRGWISEGQFLWALNFCMLLPGPEAQQLATYIGWRLHGIPGGIAAGALFVIPLVFIILLLSYLAVAHIHVTAVAAAVQGIQAVVALLRIGKQTLQHYCAEFSRFFMLSKLVDVFHVPRGTTEKVFTQDFSLSQSALNGKI